MTPTESLAAAIDPENLGGDGAPPLPMAPGVRSAPSQRDGALRFPVGAGTAVSSLCLPALGQVFPVATDSLALAEAPVGLEDADDLFIGLRLALPVVGERGGGL